MIVGPNAFNFDALSGNYHGVSSHMVTFLEGITAAAGTAIAAPAGMSLRPKIAAAAAPTTRNEVIAVMVSAFDRKLSTQFTEAKSG